MHPLDVVHIHFNRVLLGTNARSPSSAGCSWHASDRCINMLKKDPISLFQSADLQARRLWIIVGCKPMSLQSTTRHWSGLLNERAVLVTQLANRCQRFSGLGSIIPLPTSSLRFRKRKLEDFARIPETVALQIPRQDGALRIGIRGRSQNCDHKMSASTARREDADQWSS